MLFGFWNSAMLWREEIFVLKADLKCFQPYFRGPNGLQCHKHSQGRCIGIGKIVKGQESTIYFLSVISLPSHRWNVALTEANNLIFVKGACVCVFLCLHVYVCV